MKLQLKVEQPRIALNLNGKAEITFTTNKYLIEELKCLKTEFLELTIKEWHDKRSLNQNSLMWSLINQLAEKYHEKSEVVYQRYIRDYGVKDYMLLQDKAVDKFIELWKKNGLGNYAEPLRNGKIEGTTTVVVYYGSSTYDSKQMMDLITPIINDCEEQGIPTIKRDDFMKLKNENDVAPDK